MQQKQQQKQLQQHHQQQQLNRDVQKHSYNFNRWEFKDFNCLYIIFPNPSLNPLMNDLFSKVFSPFSPYNLNFCEFQDQRYTRRTQAQPPRRPPHPLLRHRIPIRPFASRRRDHRPRRTDADNERAHIRWRSASDARSPGPWGVPRRQRRGATVRRLPLRDGAAPVPQTSQPPNEVYIDSLKVNFFLFFLKNNMNNAQCTYFNDVKYSQKLTSSQDQFCLLRTPDPSPSPYVGSRVSSDPSRSPYTGSRAPSDPSRSPYGVPRASPVQSQQSRNEKTCTNYQSCFLII